MSSATCSHLSGTEEEQSASPTEDEEEVNVIPWHYLPAIPLTIILSYLDDEGRGAASQVCKSWNSVFRTASLWKNRSYTFGGYRSNKRDITRLNGYARHLGQHLRCLQLSCSHPAFTICRQIQRGLSSFFGILTWKRAKLFHFQFNNLQTDRYWRYDFLRARLVSSLGRFLRHQPDINCFEMDRATFQMSQGIRVLESLVFATGPHIAAVNMEDFFAPRIAPFSSSRLQWCMSKFHNLTMIQTNYNYISESILSTLCHNCANTLLFISIKVYRFDPHGHTIDSFTWNECKRKCPHLTVRVSFEGVGDYGEIKRILPCGMPLTNVSIWTGLRHSDNDWKNKEMITYLTDNFGKYLEDVQLSLETGHELIDEELLKMLESSPNLEYLDVQAPVQVETIHAICKLQEEYKIGLARCHINTEKLAEDAIDALSAVEKEYESMFYERGIDFIFTATDLAYF